MKHLAILCSLLLAAGCFGCAPAAEVAPPAEETPAVLATPVLTATPAPTPSPGERAAALEGAWREAFAAQPLPVGPEEQTMSYGEIVAWLPLWLEGVEQVERAAEAAFAAACAKLGEAPGSFAVDLPGWKLLASLYHRFGGETPALLAEGAQVLPTIGETAQMVCSFRDLRAVLAGAGQEGERAFGPKLTYAYLNTVYDDEAAEKDFEQYPLTEEYLKNLQDPLPGHHIKDGWYNDRDRGARKHTGTDIRAKEDTPILSCTDGVVCHIGSNSGAGNYVVVLDEEGFEYHYYHMVRLTDFLRAGERVQKGECVGHVGNTGNSSANHLHLTVISPDYTYINPYPMLRDMRALQERE